MTALVLAILFGLNFLLFPCEGQVSLPPEGNTFVVLPGKNVTIAWKLDVSVSDVLGRSWTFLPKDSDSFAQILGDGVVQNKIQYSPGPFTIIKPSTLILKNVTIQYNGTYSLLVSTFRKSKSSEVIVFVAEKPNVTINCPSHITLDEGDDFTCVCTSEGRNPPANLTWYKDGKQIGNPSYGENRLTLINVNKDDNGIITCKAQGYTLKDEKSIEVKVDSKPKNTTLTPNTAIVGTSVVITCKSEGLPEPNYTITRNGTVVSTDKTYTISEVMESDAGTCTYKCIASNKLGNDSACSNLTVVEPRPTPTRPPLTKPPSTKPQPTSKKSTTTNPVNTAAKKEDDGTTTVVVWHIVVTLVSGFILGILFSCIVSCSRRRWFRNGTPEPKTTEVDTTYQELDLSKMNTENNYQSLRVNAARNDAANDDESTYTELNKTRDVENNYQSLT